MPFHFLELSAELRNRIYHFAAISDRPILVSCTRNNEATNESAGGTFAGLTRVCHQIRHEYRPIQRQEARIGVDLEEVNTYLETFHDDPRDLTSEPQHLLITLKPMLVRLEDVGSAGIDLLPLLRFLGGWLQTRCNSMVRSWHSPICLPHGVNWDHVVEGACDECGDLNRLLDNDNSTWLRHIQDGRFDRITVRRQSHFGLSIVIACNLNKIPDDIFEMLMTGPKWIAYNDYLTRLGIYERFSDISMRLEDDDFPQWFTNH
ncbi:hypothetical protein P153DRAFT_381065 [Dothidotthia symphoricarpi CBS 119687]|uniref:Uncharacterized protein n=1 Tax=Dothidotthia symphoricarpi CBS 119687 TaxID=1392245 RepID=A0A6A6ASD1_9PLEO|nr:uncharacterized protein P153DRAFT_381065 [Dothidotthia symphoricarpi CBS 119687]KAF2133895.1 hypothetical protein P153DRAFT_381065 [Dothidotthia symphoricarpi CBS 119687]